jgi:beta-galactosidase
MFETLARLVALSLLTSSVVADPLTIDASHVPSPRAINLGQGTNADPQGHVLTADSQALYLDGQPWIPMAGEFHFTRYPRGEWRDELLKMKAGGLNTVSTYVFWIHHEETKGEFNWSGRRSLRDFLQLCQEVGLKAIVRIGPWAHGEVRNGGFPDWVQKSGTKLRSADPAFLALVAPFYQQMAEQMKGLLWKDGGPVIAVQLDNEVSNVPYLLALKRMARSDGIDVPFYTMTGWDRVALPQQGILPMFGGYPDGFWRNNPDSFRKFYVFSPIRDDGNMGADLTDVQAARNQHAQSFPYLCCEEGGGMSSSVTKRVLIAPEDVATLALIKLGNGSNMPGYYMYHGGINPDGKTHLNEEHPNPMAVKDYDFIAPVGACGEIRGQYHLLREQHLFLQNFGSLLAPMPAFFPDKLPASLHDTGTVRWSVRSNGRSGFLFFSNYERYDKMADHPGVQFSVKTKNGPLLIPNEAVTIPSGDFGIWPINLDCYGIMLRYATAQPLARLADGKATWYFFIVMPGIDADFVFAPTHAVFEAATSDKDPESSSVRVHHITPGTSEAFRFTQPDGSSVHFVVLSPEQGRQVWRAPFAGRDRLILSQATVLSDKGKIRLQANDPANLTAAIFPPPTAAISGEMDGVFEQIETAPVSKAPPVQITVERESPAATADPQANPLNDSTWKNASSWKLDIPPGAANRHLLLGIYYIGNAARLYDGDTLLDDNLYKGTPFDVGLWRIPADHYANLRLKILPYTDNLAAILPAQVRDELAKSHGETNTVSVTVTEQFELQIGGTP